MVSAVFHSPLGAAESSDNSPPKVPATAPKAAAQPAAAAAASAPVRPVRAPIDWRSFWLVVLPPAVGMALLVGIWALLTMNSSTFPTPAATFDAAVKLFSDPFYRNGPNDQGIGWNVLNSLQRVGMGFGLAALVGIPAGFMIGRFAVLNRMVSPLVSLLRPVSPLAWLPIGLLVFKAANPASASGCGTNGTTSMCSTS